MIFSLKVVSRVTDRLNEAMEAEGEQAVPFSKVQDTFSTLVKCHFLERFPCSATSPSTEAPVFCVEDRFRIPDLDVGEIMHSRKRKLESSTSDQPPGKRPRLDPDADDGIYWRMNHERFDLLFRDRALVKAVENRLDKTSSEIFRVMLQLNELTNDPKAEVSPLQTRVDIFHRLPNELAVGNEQFQQYMNLISEDRCGFITKMSEAGGGATFLVQLRRAITNLAAAHVESFIQGGFQEQADQRIVIEFSPGLFHILHRGWLYFLSAFRPGKVWQLSAYLQTLRVDAMIRQTLNG
jgi:hypothetical protein